MEQKEALFSPDIREEGGPDLPEKFPYRAGLVIPIRFEENFLGTLSVYNKLQFSTFSSTVFTEDDLEILERFNLYVARSMLNINQFNQQQAGVTIDPLTGLRNEQYLKARLPEEVRRAERYHRQVSLIFVDVYAEVDGNRKELDEEAVRKIGLAVRETFRFIDVLVHLKDSKFAALLPDTGEGVRLAVTRIGNRLAQEAKAMGQSLRFLAGYGTYPTDGPDVIDLIKKASKLSPYPE
jgi:diguanylate cyclase (GGDEF)-like protein